MLVSAGFSLHEVHDMTLDQVRLYVAAVNRSNKVDAISRMNELRIAQHADGKEFGKIIRDMKRELNG